MKRIKNALPIVAGYTLIGIGLAGLILPILPGWILIFFGIALLGEQSKVGSWVRARLPERLRNALDEVRARIIKR